ncbi:MAG: molybdopterin biosynthesis protein [Planctomycetaceae bacterium]
MTTPRQNQFLDVVTRDEATQRLQSAINMAPIGTEIVPLVKSLGRTLASDITSGVDVTAFDRSNVDGFAVLASDTSGATEETPVTLALNSGSLTPGIAPNVSVTAGHATQIATGSVVPRGANAIVMVEDTDVVDGQLVVTRAIAAGANISYAGTDIALGELVLRKGEQLTSREIGMLAAIGRSTVEVFRKPRVAVISTGNEIISTGEALPTGCVYDSNQAILSVAIIEAGGEPVPLGVVRDDEQQLRDAIAKASDCDIVLLSGGTSKGDGDLCYRIVSEFSNPGILAHGVALKPGKPVCLAVENGRPIVVLPGFPTSAVFTFHEFVAPVIRAFAGIRQPDRATMTARLAQRVNSVRGRTEYLLVHLIRHTDGDLVAYPMGKGSGSVTTFSKADGFIAIDQNMEIVEADSPVSVTLLSDSLKPADLVFIGSHCRGVDVLMSEMHAAGFTTKVLHVGSLAGVQAAKRGDCDIAGTHLLDEATGEYNKAWLNGDVTLIPGYTREQGFVFRPDDARFDPLKPLEENIAAALANTDCIMVNRNRGSGTRVIADQILNGARPAGYAIETRSHNAVCAAVSQRRADWGIAIRTVASEYGLGFIPVRDEKYEFVIPKSRANTPAIQHFVSLLADPQVCRTLHNWASKYAKPTMASSDLTSH